MSGYVYGESEPKEPCPYCGTACRADWVDIGVGFSQCGPFHCETCGASEIGPGGKDRVLSERERETGWYAPGEEPDSEANVIAGKVVDYREMRAVYADAFAGAEDLRRTPGYVEGWRDRLRRLEGFVPRRSGG